MGYEGLACGSFLPSMLYNQKIETTEKVCREAFCNVIHNHNNFLTKHNTSKLVNLKTNFINISSCQ